MKKIFLALITLANALFASNTAPRPLRFQYIMDTDGKIMATKDNQFGTIEYQTDPKKVVDRLIDILGSSVPIDACKEQIALAKTPAQPTPPADEKATKHKPKGVPPQTPPKG